VIVNIPFSIVSVLACSNLTGDLGNPFIDMFMISGEVSVFVLVMVTIPE
jgi:hypothetical protein